jgi:cytochrome P450
MVLKDRRFSSNPKITGFPLVSRSHVALIGQAVPALPQMDAPEHTKMRSVLASYLGRRQADAMRSSIQSIVDDRIDDLLGRQGVVDLVADFAVPISSMTIAGLLGLPTQDRPFFASRTEVRFDRRSAPSEAAKAQEDLEAYMSSLINLSCQSPREGLIGELVRNCLVPSILSKSELEVIGTSLLQAGYATVVCAIPLGILSLLQQPAQRDHLLSGSVLLSDAVDEILRFHTIGDIGLPRVALQDVQVGSTWIRAGEGIIVSLPAVNRDPKQFSDPNSLLLDRNEGVHLTFGAGAHHCIGHDLAKLEMEIAIETIFRKLPGLRLAVPIKEIQVETEFSLHGIRALPVTW